MRLFVATCDDICCHHCPIYIRLYISVCILFQYVEREWSWSIQNVLLVSLCLKCKTIQFIFYSLLILLLWAVMYASFHLSMCSFLIILILPKLISLLPLGKAFLYSSQLIWREYFIWFVRMKDRKWQSSHFGKCIRSSPIFIGLTKFSKKETLYLRNKGLYNAPIIYIVL